MATQPYDPYSFLEKYTQRSEEGLPLELQNITRGYLDPYEWYGNLVQRLRETQDINVLGETPVSDIKSYINTFIADGHIEAAASLMDYLIRYLKSTGQIGRSELYYRDTFLGYLELFLSHGLYEEARSMVKNYFTKDQLDYEIGIAADLGYMETVKLFVEQGAYDLEHGLYRAARSDHRAIVDYLLFLLVNDPRFVLGRPGVNDRIQAAAGYAAEYNHPELANYLRPLKDIDFKGKRAKITYV